MLFSALLFCMVFLWASGAADPNINVNVDININGKSAIGGGGGSSNEFEDTEDVDPEDEYAVYPDQTCSSPKFMTIAGTEYGCPCSYFQAIPADVEVWPGAQCCQPSICPNSNFTKLHVCARTERTPYYVYGEACRNSEDALEFARQAWTDPNNIDLPMVFSCQGITYNFNSSNGGCYFAHFVQAWSCQVESGYVTECRDAAGLCKVGSYADTGTYIYGSLICEME